MLLLSNSKNGWNERKIYELWIKGSMEINQIAHITYVACFITETIAKHEDIQKKNCDLC